MKIFKPLYLLLLLFSFSILHVRANIPAPEISIVTDAKMGQVAIHGLEKLITILQEKHITFEKVTSGANAHGRILLVTGLAYGDGMAAHLLKTGNHAVPKTEEALTIWKTIWQTKPATVISGYDDKGMMYGLLDVANRISWSTDRSIPLQYIKEVTSKPDTKERGIAMYTMNRAYWESRFYDENFWAQCGSAKISTTLSNTVETMEWRFQQGIFMGRP